MPSSGRLARIARALEAAVAAFVIVGVVLGGSVWALTNPVYVRTLVKAVDSAPSTGLGEPATLAAAESVRRFVVDPEAPALPSMIGDAPAFDEAAVAHLVDVRDVMVPARWLTLGLLIAVIVWASLRVRTAGGRRTLARACALASALMFGGAALALVVGLTDFDAFFAWFHSLFFAEGTWVFPYEALLIRIFPLPFWTAAAATWGALVLVCATGLCWFSRRSRFTAGTYGV